MSQVDLENLISVCGSNDNNGRKIASVHQPDQLPPSPVGPPHSFWFSRGAEFEWFDRNAVLERKGSLRGNSSSNSTPSSLRLPVKNSILSLPKQQMSGFTGVTYRRSLTGVTFFPRRAASNGGTEASPPPMDEPSSTKVSCMGRVRSKRDKNRHLRHQSATSESETSKLENTMKKRGCRQTLRAIFRSTKHEKKPQRDPTDAPPPAADPVQKNEPKIGPTGLLGTKRFISGRKADSLIGDLDLVLLAKNLVKSEPSDRGPVRRRGNVGPHDEFNSRRSGQLRGPGHSIGL